MFMCLIVKKNPVLDMIDFVMNNYKGKPQIKAVKKLSSYKYQTVRLTATVFDNYIVLNSLPKSYTSIKIIKTSRGLIKWSFKAGSAYEDDREIPKYMKFVCSKCHISSSLKDNQKEYNIQPQLSKGETAHDSITLLIYKKNTKIKGNHI